MPNRIIREGILSSDSVNKLSAVEEVFYRRLMSVADDFGRYDGRPEVIAASCYPLRYGTIKTEEIELWKRACEDAGLIRCYEVLGRSFLQIENFRQKTRAKSSKYPSPTDSIDPEIEQPPNSNEGTLIDNSLPWNEKTASAAAKERMAIEIYGLYPKQVDRGHALKAIINALEKIDFEKLKQAVKRFADSCRGKDQTFIPSPRRWFEGERWDDKIVQSNAQSSDEEIIDKEWAKIRKSPKDLTPEQLADLHGESIPDSPPAPNELTVWPDQKKAASNDGPDAISQR